MNFWLSVAVQAKQKPWLSDGSHALQLLLLGIKLNICHVTGLAYILTEMVNVVCVYRKQMGSYLLLCFTFSVNRSYCICRYLAGFWNWAHLFIIHETQLTICMWTPGTKVWKCIPVLPGTIMLVKPSPCPIPRTSSKGQYARPQICPRRRWAM